MESRRENPLGAEFEAGSWRVHPAACRIVSGDRELRLRPLTMNLLVTLAAHAGEVLSKDRILESVWEAEFVGESSLTREVALLRQILGDSRANPRYIETIAKRGYRFVATVRPDSRRAPARLAVLLFANLNRDPELDYFSEGLSDVLITELASITSLRVISRQSVLHYRNSDKTLQEIARELKVDAIVEGSVLHRGEMVRINAQLVKAEPEEHLWANDFDCQVGDALAVQAKVARAVADSVHATMTPHDVARLSREIRGGPETHRAYLKARFHLMRWTKEDFQAGLRYLNEVVARDPTFAPAHELLAVSLLALDFFGHSTTGSVVQQAMEAARKAVELDDGLGDAHASLGLALMPRDPAAAESQLIRAVELSPSSAFVRLSYALFLQRIRGDSKGAVEQAELALETDPLDEHTNFSCAWVLFFAGEYERAAEQAARTLEMYRDSLMACYVLGWAKLGSSRPLEAVTAFEKAVALSRDAFGLGFLGHAYGVAGRREAALAVLDELLGDRTPQGAPPTALAYLYVGLGDFDRAFESLAKAARERDPRIFWFVLSIQSQSFRADPRFAMLISNLRPAAQPPASTV